LVQRIIPVAADVMHYQPATLRKDLVAGLTVAALAMPASMAFAEVARLPPVAGLYALVLPPVIYAIAGSSKRLMVGPEGATATLTAAAIGPIVASDPSAATGAAATLAVLVGIVYLVARVVRLGWIADYLSRPVLVGYIHGVAIVLIIGQLGKLTGVSVSADRPIPKLVEFVSELSDVSLATVAVSVCVLTALALFRWLAPGAPAPLIVVVVAIVVSYIADLAAHGIAVIGAIPAGLPSFTWPGIGLGDMQDLLLPAIGIFAVSFADSILTARSYAGRHLEHVRANQELYALGFTSIVSGVTQGFPVSASGARTAVADAMGVRTQVAAIFSAIAVILTLLFLTEPMSYLPTAALAGIIVFAGISLLSRSGTVWRDLALQSRREVVIAAITTLGVITVGLLPALVLAVALSIFDAVSRSARPHDAVLGYVPRLGRWANVELHSSAQTEPGIVVYRLDDRLFFANTSYARRRIREAIDGAAEEVNWLVFDAESVTMIDTSGLEALELLSQELKRRDISLVIAAARRYLIDSVSADGLSVAIGGGPMYPSVQAAVDSCRGKPPRADA
jgi:high affinity sulfate transporter 1